MKFLLSIILTSSVAVGVALVLSQKGYITFWWSHWRVDVAISTFLIALFLIFIIFWFTSKILFEIFSLPEKARKYRHKLKETKKVELVLQLFFSYFQRNYMKVIVDAKKIQKNFKPQEVKDTSSITLVNYLTALAADKVGNSSLRDSCMQTLDSTQKKDSNSYFFVDLLKLEILLKSQKTKEAINFVSQVQKKHGDKVEFLKLQVQVNEAVKDWEEVLRLTRLIEKRSNVISFDKNYYKYLSIENLFMSAKSDPASIKKVIGLIKNDYRQDAKLTYLISSACMKIGNEKKTREILEEFLDKKWDDKVLSFYTDCFFESKISFKKFAEWEKSFSERYEFQLHYGNVCKKQKLWGKAQQHYEKSIEIKPSVDALVSLAEIHIVLNNEEAALKCWKKAAHHALEN